MNIQDFNPKNRSNMVNNITENKVIREMNEIISEANDIFPLFESVLDPIQKYRCDTLFGENNKEKSPEMKKEAREFLLKIADKFIEDINIPGAKIKEFFMIGSSLGFQYREDSDIDCDLRINVKKEDMSGKFSMIPKNIFYPGTSHPVNVFLLCDDDPPYNFEEHCENAYDLLENKWIKQGFLRNEYPIPYSYVAGVSEFIMDGIALQMQRADRHIQDVYKYISLDPNKVEISARERIDAISDSINDLKIDMDALNLSHHFLFRFDGEGFSGEEFRINIDYKASAKHFTINNLIYKYVDSFGYFDKINAKIKEVRAVIEKAENVLEHDNKLSDENIEHERVQKEIEQEVLKEEREYTKYVKGHIKNLKTGYRWLKKYLPEIFPKGYFNDENRKIRHAIRNHDKSKWDKDEYKTYSEFQKIRKMNLSDEEYDAKKGEFNIAWNHHQKSNPHHWQYWVLMNANGTTKVLDMPYENIIEMICDWWTFSWKENNLYSIFDWYNKNKDQMILSPNTRSKIENILNKMKVKIREQESSGMLREYSELVDLLEQEETLNESKKWNINDFDTAEEIGRELERLHTDKENSLKNDDKPSFYYENIDNHIRQLKDKMKKFDCKCEEINESRLPEDGSDPQFGIPQQKKYPLYDKTHVEAAIKMFVHVDAEYEQQLARAIIVKMKKFGIPYDSVSPENKLYKWIPESYKKNSP